MRFYLQVAMAVLVAVAVGYFSTAAHAEFGERGGPGGGDALTGKPIPQSEKVFPEYWKNLPGAEAAPKAKAKVKATPVTCPQNVIAQGQCFQQQQVFAQQVYQPQAVVLQNVAPQYVVQQPQFVVQQQYGAQAVVVGHNRQQVIVRQQRAQKVVVQNGRQRSRQTVIVRNR